MDKYIRILPRTLVRSLRNFWLLSLDLRDRFRGTGDDLIPPRSLHYVGDGDFKAVGQRFLRHFVYICGLQPDETSWLAAAFLKEMAGIGVAIPAVSDIVGRTASSS